MAQKPTRSPQESAQAPPGTHPREPTPFEKMTELTRRLVHVRKDELPNKGKPGKRKPHR